MSLETFPPADMTSTSSASDEKTPLMRSISASNDALNRTSSGHLIQRRHLPSQLPAQNSFLPLVCVLLTVVLERITYYGILANLLIFLINEIEFTPSLSVGIVFGFTGLAWLMSTIGGIVGDSYSGRYNAVWGSLLVYIVGVGAYKANVTAFGGDQLRGQDDTRYRRFFNWYYWSINIGSFVGFFAIAYVEQVDSFWLGFAILFGCIVLAAVIFCICKSRYISHPPTGHILKNIYNIIKEARHRNKDESIRDSSSQYYPGLEEYMPVKSWLDRAMMKYGGSYLDTDVEEVKTIGKIIAIFAILIPYWAIYFQMNSTFLLQGLHMKISLINDTIDSAEDLRQVPPAWLSLVDVIFVLILIPVMDKWIYPWLDRKGWSLSVFTRISIGFLFATGSMVVAAGVESARLNAEDSRNCVNQTVAHANYTACMPIYFQIPQYGLIGISEVFASVGALEFAYKEAPKSMHSFVMGLFFFTQSIGSMLGGGLFELCSLGKHPWTPELNSKLDLQYQLKGHLNYYFLLLAGLQFVTWMVFLAVTVKYKIIQFNRKRTLPVIQRSQSYNPQT
ncbi:hypothetical protein OS493_030106 [Desmophyllum pertusum]|uniref:Uncharacterized protein n=1 Tax=Desmophyllum pertusum TaxID=174260 RepID=A0A9X0CXP9_9CNID|nr:hypothetical protein OS493_030106 [Desmophyllum pertusum]